MRPAPTESADVPDTSASLENELEDLRRLHELGKELAGMGTWELTYGEDRKPRIHWSDECYELLGIPANRAEGTVDSFLTYIHRYDVDMVRSAVRAKQEPGPMRLLEFRVIHPGTGEQRWIALQGYVFPNRRVLGVMQDVTDRHEAREEAARSDRGLRSLFESSKDGLVLYNNVMKIVDINSAACEIYGGERDEMLGSYVGERSSAAAEDRGGNRGLGGWDELERFKRGEVLEHRRTVARRDGTKRELQTIAIPNFLDGLHLAILRDITEQENAAQALRKAEARYRSLVEELPLVTYTLGRERMAAPTYVSPQIEQLLGHPADHFIGWQDFLSRALHPDDRERVLAELAELEDTAPFESEYRVLARDGSVVWVINQMVPVHDEAGEWTGYRGFLVDGSRRKQLEEQLHRSQRLETIGQLAGGIAHDFNNLLTAISGYSGFALERVGDENDKLRNDIVQIQRAAERAAGLTQQLLAFSRRQVLQPTTLDLNEVVDEVHALLARLIGEHIELVTVLSGRELFVRADRGRLEQVLVNLAVNARDAMGGGGTLTIECADVVVDAEHPIAAWGAALGTYAALVVRDTGSGMDAETLAHVFEPFFTTKGLGTGTGLGLSTVYGIVKQSGGWITFDSEIGEGTTATVYLPHAEAPVEEQDARTASARRGAGTILLVEDEAIVRDLVAKMLEEDGYDVVDAPDPLAAVELAQERAYDLLLTDVVMPKLNGRQLAEQIRERLPDLHVVYMSGYAPEAVLDGGRLDKGEFFLQKPFSVGDLTTLVRDALAGAAPA
jgi:two-component system, cell cycle sensor histidine kinase and response regulator CckA